MKHADAYPFVPSLTAWPRGAGKGVTGVCA